MKNNTQHALRALVLGAACLACGATWAQADTKLFAAAEAARADYLTGLAQLVNLDSGSLDAAGLDKVADVLAARLKALGADELINYKEHAAWGMKVLELTGGVGVRYPAGDREAVGFRIRRVNGVANR